VILTVTLNPALHVRYRVPALARRGSHEVSQVTHSASGAGLAVARVLHTFGHDVLAAGLAGGATGELLRTDLARAGVPARFTLIGRESRRVTEVSDGQGEPARFSEPAPFITTEELGRLASDYRLLLGGAAAVVLSGSLPAGIPRDIYATLATYAADAGVPAVIDAGGAELLLSVRRRPALVIPDPAVPAAPAAPAAPGLARPPVAGHATAGAAGRDADPQGARAGYPPGRAGGAEGDAAAGRGCFPPGGRGGQPRGGPDGQGEPGLAGGLDPSALLATGAGAVVLVAGAEVRAVTRGGQWRASADCDVGRPGAREALVAGCLPGLLFGWSWPDRLRHAVALAAAVTRAGEVDLGAYERLLPGVPVSRA
jgi:tagatose 6-phosphate kinase